MIDGLRRAVLGKVDLSLEISLVVGSLLAGTTLVFAIYLFHKGYKLVVQNGQFIFFIIINSC